MSNRFARLGPLLFAAAAATATCGVASASSRLQPPPADSPAAAEPSPGPDDPDVLPPDDDLPADDARVLVDLDEVYAAAAATFGSNVGPRWFIGRGATSALVISVEGLAPDQGDLFEAGHARVQVVEAPRSQLALQTMIDQVTGVLRSDGLEQWDVGIELEGSGASSTPVIVVGGLPSASFTSQRLIREIVPPDLLREREAGGIENDSFCTDAVSRDYTCTFPPFMGGLANFVYDGATGALPTCTSAFLVRGAFGDFGMTAGHCALRAGEHGVIVGDTVVDTVRRNTYYDANPNVADVAIYALSPGNWPREPRIRTGDTTSRLVTGRFNGPLALNSSVCFSGVNSGNKCGVVDAVNVSAVDERGRVTQQLDCFALATAQPGDSGSPIYTRPTSTTATAAGVLKGGRAVPPDVCYSRINNAVFLTGAELVTG